MIKELVLFTLLNLVYVILNTVKSVLQIKGGKTSSTIITGICYGYYCIIIKAMTQYGLVATIIGTIVSNFVGNYLGLIICEKFLNEQKCYKITLSKQDVLLFDSLEKTLRKFNVGYNYYIAYGTQPYYKVSIYISKKGQEKVIQDFIKNNKIIKYHIEKD